MPFLILAILRRPTTRHTHPKTPPFFLLTVRPAYHHHKITHVIVSRGPLYSESDDG